MSCVNPTDDSSQSCIKNGTAVISFGAFPMIAYDYAEAYENPMRKALEYERIMKEEKLTQSALAKKLGISRVRITQILNLC